LTSGPAQVGSVVVPAATAARRTALTSGGRARLARLRHRQGAARELLLGLFEAHELAVDVADLVLVLVEGLLLVLGEEAIVVRSRLAQRRHGVEVRVALVLQRSDLLSHRHDHSPRRAGAVA
jgi:hypothetical protein